MTRFLLSRAAFMFAVFALAQPSPASSPASRKLRIDGKVHVVSARDIRTVLALMPGHFRERHSKPAPIVGIHVVDHDTMEVHYSPDTFTYARRIKGQWHIDYADTERVKVDGSLHPRLMNPRDTPNQTMERTAGSFGSFLPMKFHPQPAATRSPASRRSSYSR